MNEKTRVKLIGVILAATVIWGGFSYKSEPTKTENNQLQTIQPLDSAVQLQKNNYSFIDVEKFESFSWGRSPFYLAELATKELPKHETQNGNALVWTLSGIIYNNSSSTAIINRKPVKTGDTVDKAVVTSIEKDKVTIKYNNKKIDLTVSKG